MNSLIFLSDSSSIAIHAMLFLAINKKKPATQPEIATTYKISIAHLNKVMQLLRKADLVITIRGPNGGFLLAKEAKDISLLDIHEAVRGKTKLTSCLLRTPVCEHKCCLLGKKINKIEQELINYLKETKLEELTNLNNIK